MAALTPNQIARAEALTALSWTPERISSFLKVPVAAVQRHLASLSGAPPIITMPVAREVEVPSWVPAHLTGLYLNVAKRHGEEEAASTCRKLKNGRSITQSRLPAVVSPAGC